MNDEDEKRKNEDISAGCGSGGEVRRHVESETRSQGQAEGKSDGYEEMDMVKNRAMAMTEGGVREGPTRGKSSDERRGVEGSSGREGMGRKRNSVAAKENEMGLPT